MSHAASTKRPRTVPLYERDLYAWSQEQARLLKEGRLAEVDTENVAEKILDVGSNEYDKLESALSVLLMHMLNGTISRTGGHDPGRTPSPSSGCAPCGSFARTRASMRG